MTDYWLDSLKTWQVLAHRLPMMAEAGFNPTSVQSREINRMVMEKQQAAIDGMFALQSYFFNSGMTMMLGGKNPFQNNDFAQKMVDAYTSPARRTLSANAKRLSKRKS